MTAAPRPSGPARTLLQVAAAIVLAEAAVFAVLAVLEVLSVSSERVGLGVGATLFLTIVAAGLAWAASRVVVGETWARSPLVLAQLVQLGLAFNFRGDPWWLAPAIAAPAVVTLVCLLAPPVNRALTPDRLA